MKLGMANKSTIVQKSDIHTLPCNITRSAILTRQTT